MEQILFLMAAMMPEDKIIEELTDACSEYKLVPTAENKHKVLTYSTLLLTKATMSKDGVEGFLQASAEFDKLQKAQSLFKTEDN